MNSDSILAGYTCPCAADVDPDGFANTLKKRETKSPKPRPTHNNNNNKQSPEQSCRLEFCAFKDCRSAYKGVDNPVKR